VKFLIINQCPLQNHSLSLHLNASVNCTYVAVTNSLDDALNWHEREVFDVVVISSEIAIEHLRTSRLSKKIRRGLLGALKVVLVCDICPFEIARLLVLEPAIILHTHDAIDFLKRGSLISTGLKNSWISESIRTRIGKLPDDSIPLETLNEVEVTVLALILQDESTKEISHRISRSEHTVHDYRKRIKEKLAISGGKRTLQKALEPYIFHITTLASRIELSKV
jgi:DNA-binding NarL/FixJ family response regulator